MVKRILSVLMAASMLLFLMIPASLARPPQKNWGQSGSIYQEQSQPALQENAEDNVSVTEIVYNEDGDEEEEEDNATDDVYGKNKGKHKGIANALQNVKNPRARAVLQAILDGRSVSEAVYQYKMIIAENTDPDEIQTVTNEAYAGLSQDDSVDSREKALTFRYMAQIQIKAGKVNEALKFMEYSARNNPGDDETFRELDRIHAGKQNLSVKVYVNGKNTDFDVLPKIVEGRTLVPVRFIAEGLNADVYYDGDTETVTVQGAQMSIKMKINSKIALVNGQEVQLDVPATIESGRTIVPLRFISENFKCKVNFYGESNLVTVNNQ
ncbi:MAG: copper amine oxidase N-terminal domain-containing protein [Bacillota bacterium]